MSWIASRQDFYAYGLAAAACVPDSRALGDITPGAPGIIELPGHGFAGGEFVRIKARGTGSALPTGLVATTIYAVATPISDDLITLLDGASPVAFSTVGAGALVLLENMGPKLDRLLASWSSYVRAHAKAYNPDWSAPPDWAPMTVCHLAAYDFAMMLRVASPQYSIEDLKLRAGVAQAFCARLDRGTPYNDSRGPVDGTPKVAEMGAVSVSLTRRSDFQLGDREGVA